MIVDQCPECKRGDLDFSFPVYRDITGASSTACGTPRCTAWQCIMRALCAAPPGPGWPPELSSRRLFNWVHFPHSPQPGARPPAGKWPHRLTVQWQWADCAPFVNGSIRLWPKDGSNPYWQAFFFANLK